MPMAYTSLGDPAGIGEAITPALTLRRWVDFRLSRDRGGRLFPLRGLRNVASARQPNPWYEDMAMRSSSLFALSVFFATHFACAAPPPTATPQVAAPTVKIIEYVVPTPNSSPFDLVSDYSGNLWFTESAANKIGKLTTAGQFVEYATNRPNFIAFDPFKGQIYRGLM